MIIFYNLFIALYSLGIRLVALWNKKAAELVKGRETLFDELEDKRKSGDRVIWMHCASAGELEQGKPLIEALKEKYPEHKVLVSFFSPSGYAAGKKYASADWICYLPSDTSSHARRFVKLVNPELVIFIKYEYWYHLLSQVAFHHIPLLLVSAIFREKQPFFKWWGKLYRQILFLYRQIFVQDEASKMLLSSLEVKTVTVSGDTRFDRVQKITSQFTGLPLIEDWVQGDKVIVGGSTWPEDEALFKDLAESENVRLILAPHEINEGHLRKIENLFPQAIRYSVLKNGGEKYSRVLIIDNYGMLSRLYHYGSISYIGGGFNKSGIHNTLEAAVFGKPVIFGPHYQKFKEARDLISSGAAFSVSNTSDLHSRLHQLMNDPDLLSSAGAAAAQYVKENGGATDTILNYIQENRLLTR